jgi:ABC-type multidrug transport system ATPase subunit/F0F1-type ATP synthase delta subunit
MSEQILKALMQLFAIIARPQADRNDRRTVVENFLGKQLNGDLVQEFLRVFDGFYATYQQKQSSKGIAKSSVRVLLICTEINEELTQKQKIFVLVQLFEFIKSDIPDSGEIDEQELEFLITVADVFRVSQEDFQLIKDFVLAPVDALPVSNKVVVINNRLDFPISHNPHLYSEALIGEVWVARLQDANMFFVRYLGNSELYLNGQLMLQDKVYIFNNGSSIRNQHIKPIYFSDVVKFFFTELHESKFVFEAKDIEYHFKGGKVGLNAMSFTEESGRLVGIMGASGAGKSTLLNVLNGTNKPTSGGIFINGINIHTDKKKIEGIIGFVSQDDLLIEELSVYQNLYYNAKLCFDNLTDAEICTRVNDVLQNLGLFDIKDMKVGSPLNKKISGGQRKRLNIALELIREPSVLFLDEPTSGLSSRDSENIMDLLKELSFKGKLVFVVIHQPSSDIFKMFDKLLILDTGGYLIYNGDPIESIIYFKSRMHHANWNESECHECGNVNPEQVFNIVESHLVNEYGKSTHTRRITPREWSQYFVNYSAQQVKQTFTRYELPKIPFRIPGYFTQFKVFVKRDVLAKISNVQYLIINFMEAPLLAFILSFLIRYFNVGSHATYTFSNNTNVPVYIFMSVIVAIFVGMSVSAEEIIKDRKILKREAFLNLSWASYLFSKVAVQFGIAALQALMFVAVGNTIIGVKGMYFEYWLVLFSAWACSNIMGLLISDSFKTVVTIYILIPFLVIPQIILSGVIVKYDQLNPAISNPQSIPLYGEIITSRWAYEALAVNQFVQNDYEKIFYPYEKAMAIAHYKKNYWSINLKNKVDYLNRQQDNPEDKKQYEYAVELLKNEITKENAINPLVKYKNISQMGVGSVDTVVLSEITEYLEKISKYYIKLYNKANEQKDEIARKMEATPELKAQTLALKQASYNEKLEEFVTNKNDVDRIVEYKAHLYQKENPIFLDSESKFIKAHFYAPRKMFLGQYVNTLWINVGVIWIMTILTFICLYLRLLKRGLDGVEQFADRFSRGD